MNGPQPRAAPRSRGLLLLLDFDGTLAPIARHPPGAACPERTRRALAALIGTPGVVVAIVSGRTLPDIRARAALPGAIYAANHGLEIAWRGRALLTRGERFRSRLRRIARELEAALAGIPRVLVEDKGLSVAVHFRRVPRRHRRRIASIVRRVFEERAAGEGLSLTSGKMIREIRPARVWNKGRAARWLAARFGRGRDIVCAGDDATDEDAFAALAGRAVTIRVGRGGTTRARRRIGSVRAFGDFLWGLASARASVRTSPPREGR